MNTIKKILISFSIMFTAVGGLTLNSTEIDAKGKLPNTEKALQEPGGGWKDGETGYKAGCHLSWAVGIKDVCGELKDEL
ncbi:hypothetical protein HYE69_04345 [Staphylococcus sp. GSSP0090]|nr:hypothetical protein [Staphylococcus sp. GSSP0090]